MNLFCATALEDKAEYFPMGHIQIYMYIYFCDLEER